MCVLVHVCALLFFCLPILHIRQKHLIHSISLNLLLSNLIHIAIIMSKCILSQFLLMKWYGICDVSRGSGVCVFLFLNYLRWSECPCMFVRRVMFIICPGMHNFSIYLSVKALSGCLCFPISLWSMCEVCSGKNRLHPSCLSSLCLGFVFGQDQMHQASVSKTWHYEKKMILSPVLITWMQILWRGVHNLTSNVFAWLEWHVYKQKLSVVWGFFFSIKLAMTNINHYISTQKKNICKSIWLA